MKETKFKNTEIGMIPEEWEVKKLGTVFDIGNGRDYKHLNTGKIPVYGTGGLMTYVNEYLYDGETVCIGRKGTINMPQYHNGKIWTVDTLFYTYNFRKTDVKFLYYLAQIIDWNAYNTATGVPSLTSRNVSNILVSLPPLHEQHRIASALTSIDNLISSLGKLIEKKKNIKQGAMQQLLTGRTRLKGFSEPWVEKKLGELFKIGNGKDYKNLKSGPIPVFGTGGLMTYVNEYLYDGETICIGRKGTIDKPQLLKAPFWTVDTLFFLTPQNRDLHFLYALCQKINWRNYDESTGVPSLSKVSVSKIKFAVPSFAEQRAIASYFTSLDRQITLHTQRLEQLKQIKAACLDEMFV